MREFIDVTGKTEEEALNKALRQLGLERDDVSVEILERAKSGFLGLGSCPAKLRVSYGEEEPETVLPAEPPAPVVCEPKAEAPAPAAPAAPAPEKKAPQSVPEKAEKKEPVAAPVSYGEEVDDEKAQQIKTFLFGLLEQLETPAQIHVYLPEKGRYKVILEGENMGALIGRRGETLDAIQQLTSYSVNRSSSGRVRIQLDTEGYREKREKSLERLAHKVAGKAIRYRRNFTLEPMNAYERHVIHTALQDEPGVTTYSTGTEPNRRIVVAYAPEEK